MPSDETYNPGALYRVAVKDPVANQFVYMWSAPAEPAPQASRVVTARFIDPGYLVDQVRLEFNSPAVPGWNEIDAVGIGYETCPAALLDVSDASSPAAPGGIQLVRPNPFVSSTTIRYVLARPGHVRAEVYDVLGHRIARLVDRSVAAGLHEFRWNGCDSGGRNVGSGVYFVRLQGPDVSSNVRIVKVR